MAVAHVLGGEVQVPVDYKFQFTVENYKSVPIAKVLVSDIFTQKGDSWLLELEKLSDEPMFYTIKVRVQLKLVSTNPIGSPKIKMVRIAILTDSNSYARMEGRFGEVVTVYSRSGDKQDCNADINDLKRGGKVTVQAEVLNCRCDGVVANDLIEPPKSEMAAEVLDWLESDDFGDITVVAADGHKFRCHRDILARRSEVLKLMFICPMKEAIENVVNIEHFNREIVAAMLQFIYIDECSGIGLIADRLYVAAHQYQLGRLKIQCESALAANLSAKSVVKTYRLANFYHLDQLLARCVDYLDTHRADLSVEDLLAAVLEIPERIESRMEQK